MPRTVALLIAVLAALCAVPASAQSQTFYWVATAYDSTGIASAYSNEASKAVTPGDTASLTWSPSTMRTDGSALTDLVGYKLWRASVSGGPYGLVATVSPTTTSYTDIPVSASGVLQLTSTRLEASEWTCRDSAGAILSSHTRQDKAQEACSNLALQHPGTSYEIRPSGYRIVAQ